MRQHSGDPTTESRPWGRFTVLDDQPAFKVKRIEVEPGKRLSYQSHERRAEHWLIVQGSARITLDGVEYVLHAGEHIDIPTRARHRIENVGSVPMIFIEVQTGTYFGEDDITRYDDDFGRAGTGRSTTSTPG